MGHPGHWLTKELPEKKPLDRRKLYRLSLFDNAHNLPAETVASLLLAWPPTRLEFASAVFSGCPITH
jgi:hypothetical protein